MSTKPTVLALAGVACAAVLIAGPQTALAHPRAHTGKLKVKPGDVMVNTIVTVTGKGFAPNSSVTLRECGRTSWLVPKKCATPKTGSRFRPAAAGALPPSSRLRCVPKERGKRCRPNARATSAFRRCRWTALPSLRG